MTQMRPAVAYYPDEETRSGTERERLLREVINQEEKTDRLQLELLAFQGSEGLRDLMRLKHLREKGQLLLLRAKLDFARRHHL